jgi:hypothetical protein
VNVMALFEHGQGEFPLSIKRRLLPSLESKQYGK